MFSLKSFTIDKKLKNIAQTIFDIAKKIKNFLQKDLLTMIF